MRNFITFIIPFMLFPLFFFMMGCAGRIVNHYPGQLSVARMFLTEGKEDLAIKEINSAIHSAKDRLLYSMELGMVYYLEGDFERCIKEWLHAEELIEEFESRAVVSIRRMGEQLETLAVNDYLVTYQGMTYERVLLHTYLALAYLMRNQKEDARVELKKAEQVQNKALSKMKQQKDALLQDSPEGRKIEGELQREYATRYGISQGYTDRDLNPFVYYLSGWLYLVDGYPDEALIDYRRVWDIGIKTDSVASEINLLTRKTEPLSQNERRETSEAMGDLFIIYHQGFVPHLEEIKVPLIINNSIVMCAIPVYDQSPPSITPLFVTADTARVETREIVNVYSLAKESLGERAAGIALRQAARIAFKATLSHQISNKAGNLAGLFSNLYNIVSEKADLRSWLTIPLTIQIGRMRLPAGQFLIELHPEGSGIYKQIEMEIKAGEHKILDIHTIDSQMIIHYSP